MTSNVDAEETEALKSLNSKADEEVEIDVRQRNNNHK